MPLRNLYVSVVKRLQIGRLSPQLLTPEGEARAENLELSSDDSSGAGGEKQTFFFGRRTGSGGTETARGTNQGHPRGGGTAGSKETVE